MPRPVSDLPLRAVAREWLARRWPVLTGVLVFLVIATYVVGVPGGVRQHGRR